MDKKRLTIDGLTLQGASRGRKVSPAEKGNRVWTGEVKRQKVIVAETGNRMWTGKPRPQIELDNKKRPARASAETIAEAPRRRVAPTTGGALGAEDKIEAFLEEIKDEDPTNLVTTKDEEDTSKKNRKKNKKEKAGKKKKRHIVRWVILGLIVVILGLAVWKGVGIWGVLDGALGAMTGGDVGVGDVIAADPTIPLKQDENGRTNILVFGTSGHAMDEDVRGGDQLADTIMVVSLDQEDGNIKTFSIPRDLLSKHRCTSTGKMNETYWCEYQQHTRDERYAGVKDNPEELAKLRWEYEQKAGEKFMAIIGEVSGLELHYWVHVNWETLIEVVDAIGGIEVAIDYQGNQENHTWEVPVIWTTDTRGILDSNWDWACKNRCNYVKYSNGQIVHLDGVHAIALARARGESQPAYGTAASNWNREKNQQAILDAIVRKVKQTNFVTDLDAALNIIRAIGDNLRMSFDAEGIRRIIHLAGTLDIGGMRSIDISSLFISTFLSGGVSCERGTPGCASMVVPRAGVYDYNAIIAFIAKNLVSNPIQDEAAPIDVLNGTEQIGLAAKVSKEMEDIGYKIGEIGNTPEGAKVYAKTVIYRIGEATAPGTEKKLLERFGVGKVKTGALPEGITSEAKFVVILGGDYAEKLGLN